MSFVSATSVPTPDDDGVACADQTLGSQSSNDRLVRDGILAGQVGDLHAVDVDTNGVGIVLIVGFGHERGNAASTVPVRGLSAADQRQSLLIVALANRLNGSPTAEHDRIDLDPAFADVPDLSAATEAIEKAHENPFSAPILLALGSGSARCLPVRPGGWVALWWTLWGDPERSDPFGDRVAQLLGETSTAQRTRDGTSFEIDVPAWTGELLQRGGFVNVDGELIRWTAQMSTQQAMDFYGSTIAVRRRSAEDKSRLLNEIRSCRYK